MDHSEGVQIPRGILPAVSVLKPGLALCLKHSQIDKRYVDSHIELLSEQIPSSLYPAFIPRDTASGNLSDVLTSLHRMREEALRGNRVFFVYSPFFAARLPALIEEVDHLFFYSPGLTQPLLMTAKVNGALVQREHNEAIFIERRPRRTEERKILHVTLPEGVNPQEASRLVSEALAAHYSGKIDIETGDRNEQ